MAISLYEEQSKAAVLIIIFCNKKKVILEINIQFTRPFYKSSVPKLKFIKYVAF